MREIAYLKMYFACDHSCEIIERLLTKHLDIFHLSSTFLSLKHQMK